MQGNRIESKHTSGLTIVGYAGSMTLEYYSYDTLLLRTTYNGVQVVPEYEDYKQYSPTTTRHQKALEEMYSFYRLPAKREKGVL